MFNFFLQKVIKVVQNQKYDNCFLPLLTQSVAINNLREFFHIHTHLELVITEKIALNLN